MGIHQFDPNKRPDSDFISGDISFLVAGNACRLLDGRRTPGVIEEVFHESAMFRWRITNFEDEGKYWDVPCDWIDDYQFEKASQRLNDDDCNAIQERIKLYDSSLEIQACEEAKKETEKRIKKLQPSTEKWLRENSEFLKSGEKLDMDANVGNDKLARDLEKYMESVGYDLHEKKTSELFVLNPNSGEWIKGMSIVLAELGIVSYYGRVTRTADVFKGMGEKPKREEYLLHRLAFIRAFFSILDIPEVTVYRGMSSEVSWIKVKRTFISFTFNEEVGQSFADFKKDSHAKNSYLIKATIPVEDLFMTYLETGAMNQRYKEAEALVFNTESIVI